jgi:hypothetical protein
VTEWVDGDAVDITITWYLKAKGVMVMSQQGQPIRLKRTGRDGGLM